MIGENLAWDSIEISHEVAAVLVRQLAIKYEKSRTTKVDSICSIGNNPESTSSYCKMLFQTNVETTEELSFFVVKIFALCSRNKFLEGYFDFHSIFFWAKGAVVLVAFIQFSENLIII